MSDGREFQRRGADRLKALNPMVVNRAGKTVRLTDEEDLRVRLETWQQPGDFSQLNELTPAGEIQREKAESPEPSCVSMKSDASMHTPLTFRKEESCSEMRIQQEASNISRRNMEVIFKELEQKVISLVKKQLKRFEKILKSLDYPACSGSEEEDEEDQSAVREGALKITLHVLKIMNQTDLANTLQTKLAPFCQKNLKSALKENFKKINEGISNPGTSTLLNEIYTELYITEGGSGEVNNEHEVRQIEAASRRPATQETPIKCNDLFKDQSIRTVLTKGVAGIGKTVSVQKFILDWAEGKANQDVLFIFPLPFRELNLMKTKSLSLVDLLYQFFKDSKVLRPGDYHHYRVMFIFDGLDECRLPLDFQNNERVSDVTQSASVDVLLTNLIQGNLLPSALLWITTRPAAANQIPPDCIDQVTEVRGFSDPQKEEYFRKRISDQSLAERIITHMKSSRSLYIMCHIPVFCWISATVLERMLGEAEGGEIPKTLTQMFTHFLIFQIKHRSQKYQRKSDADLDQTREIILALGKLAFQQLEKGNLIFYEEDLRECGIDVREVSVYSGVCTQIFRQEFGLHLGTVFSFVHLSVQEFLAALYAFLSFISSNRNVLQQKQGGLIGFFKKGTMSDFLKSAVDKALQSENGNLDLFLRFLLGLLLESNQTLLRGLLTQTGNISYSKEEVVEHIKQKIRENPSPEKTISLFQCLNELNDHSLVQEVQTYLNRGGSRSLSGVKLSPSQWSAVAFMMLNSEEELEEFDLNKYDRSEECLLRLMPVIKVSRKAWLWECNLSEYSCAALTSALSSSSSTLRDLNLGNNKLQDSGVKMLSAGLENPHCKLEKLGLAGCDLSEESCAALASALSSNSSTLRELNLNNNNLQDSGVKLLSAGLKSSHCKLEKLELNNCSITGEGCASLASALKSNPSHLRELNLRYNNPGELGKKLLSDLQKDPHFKLEILQFW
ncbi:NLR family CARD domain-containing protein 3-like [Astyanax mexicanus]|uniref:NLR family CARD domain-containing protein 3-like n=1 Tax=Astyanax mexicanus TaxID=7994 RepID=UPI0020CB14A8|nr:NLR family CARD domain-containing protein 3-like [Astyanax mexicanus]